MGAAANLTDVLVGVFRTIFDMSNAQADWSVRYYGAYFSLAFPRHDQPAVGHKAGVLTGWGWLGRWVLFIPASEILVYVSS